MRELRFIAALGFLAFMSPAHALDHSEAADMLCAKTQACIMEQVQAAKISEEETEATYYQLDSMCAKIERTFSVPDGHDRLHALATYCMKALSERSCAVILKREEAKPPKHCAVFEKEATRLAR